MASLVLLGIFLAIFAAQLVIITTVVTIRKVQMANYRAKYHRADRD